MKKVWKWFTFFRAYYLLGYAAGFIRAKKGAE